jgi:NAD(P)-dependent dehydrogenase (short-subunit alcohol dehydrogenase family)
LPDLKAGLPAAQHPEAVIAIFERSLGAGQARMTTLWLPARADRRMLQSGWSPSVRRRSGGAEMRVAVTGGTGFVGSHSVNALVEEGHEVTLLARDRDRAARALTSLGVASACYDVVLGDRDAETMHRVNIDGTRAVLTAAAERGLAPIVHVSSCVALLPNDKLSLSTPVGEPHGPYARSKAQAETIARELQEQGVPVVITYPRVGVRPTPAAHG